MTLTLLDEVLDDLAAEGDRIESMLDTLDARTAAGEDAWGLPSGVAGWSVADVVLHLAQTEEGVVATLARGAGSWTTRTVALDGVIDVQVAAERGEGVAIGRRWRVARRASIEALRRADPTVAVGWAAAPLRPTTLATTRLAEHWAHALDIADPLGIDLEDTPRLRHIARLGHATLPYALRLIGEEPFPVRAELVGPGGEAWAFGPADAPDRITGSAGAFCRVGARRLPGAESGLACSSPRAELALSVLRNYAA